MKWKNPFKNPMFYVIFGVLLPIAGCGLMFSFYIFYQKHYKDARPPYFCVDEFKPPLTIEGLCEVISNDNYNKFSKTTNYTVSLLIELLKDPTFYEFLNKKKPSISSSKQLPELIRETNEYRNKTWANLNEDEKRNIILLNRLSLEQAYPKETPKVHDYRWTDAIGEAFSGTFLGLDVFFGIIFGFLSLYDKFDKKWSEYESKTTYTLQEHLKNTKQALDIFINDKQIVLNIDTTEHFNSAHISDLQDRLDKAFPNPDIRDDGTPSRKAHIYALDSTSPRQWWTESMLGYLAVIAAWKGKDAPPKSKHVVSRIFVYHPWEIKHPLA
ncbi:MAG: hypothetical protein Q6358_11935, partial [Candidatus Brocadiales bacterium]|nr:hypothetical protein [Candidatus Brocadiales bacterium]